MNLLPTQTIQTDTRIRFTIPENAASDPEGATLVTDNEDDVQLLLRVFDRFEEGVNDPNDGTLPDWMNFDVETRTLTVRPTADQAGQTFNFTLRVLESVPFPLAGDYDFSFSVIENTNPAARYDVNRSGHGKRSGCSANHRFP